MAINKTRAGSLAALAGLAYMASQKGKKGEDSGLTAADREDAEMGRAMRANVASAPTSVAKEAPAPFEADFPRQDEPKLNEYGETYTLNDTAPAPKATPRSRPTIAGKTGSGSGGGRGPKFGEREAYEESRAKTSRPATEAEKSKNAADMYIAAAKARSPVTEADKNKNAADMYTLGALAKNRDYKKGGKVKKMASGGMTSSASKRADGIATKGKTRGRIC